MLRGEGEAIRLARRRVSFAMVFVCGGPPRWGTTEAYIFGEERREWKGKSHYVRYRIAYGGVLCRTNVPRADFA